MGAYGQGGVLAAAAAAAAVGGEAKKTQKNNLIGLGCRKLNAFTGSVALQGPDLLDQVFFLL